jgi:DNA-binding transcriptional regulator YiaG
MSLTVDELVERVRSRRELPAVAERRRIREAAGVSQRELAKALGVSWTAIQRWEAGARPRTHVAEYAEALEKLASLAVLSNGSDP